MSQCPTRCISPVIRPVCVNKGDGRCCLRKVVVVLDEFLRYRDSLTTLVSTLLNPRYLLSRLILVRGKDTWEFNTDLLFLAKRHNAVLSNPIKQYRQPVGIDYVQESWCQIKVQWKFGGGRIKLSSQRLRIKSQEGFINRVQVKLVQ